MAFALDFWKKRSYRRREVHTLCEIQSSISWTTSHTITINITPTLMHNLEQS